MQKLLSFFLAAMLCLPMSAVKVHTIGDSTMADYDPNTTDKRGWGMYLGSFFDSEFVTVNNRGKSGADSRGFYAGSAFWPSVKTQMSAGDYLLIQFAHNDEGTITHGTDNEELLAYCQTFNPDTVLSDARGTNPQTTFRNYLRLFIDEARALNVTPILVSPICRAYFNGNTIKRNGQHDLGDNFWKIENGQLLTNQSLPANDSSMSYVHAMREVAKEKNVIFLDLMEETKKIYLSYEDGDACLNAMFTYKDETHTTRDATHTNDVGAMQIARAAAQLLKNAGVLAEYISIPTDISVAPNAFEIGETYCGVPQNKEFLLTGFGLDPADGSVVLTTTANLQVSLDKITYASAANAVYTGGSIFQKVYVRALYSEGGEQKDTVFVTAGEKVIAVPVHAEAISLDGGIDIRATWPINAKPAPAPEVEGPVTAEFGLSNMFYMDYSKNYFTDGDETGIVMGRFHNSDANCSSRVDWPAGEEDENASRFMDFAVTAPAAMDIRITNISLDITADATTDMCYHINAGYNDGFTGVTTLAETKGLSNRAINHVHLTPSLTIPAGKTLHIRILPWLNVSAPTPNKYICVKNVVISGKAFAAEEHPVDPEEEKIQTFGLTADLDAENHKLSAPYLMPSATDKVAVSEVPATYGVLTNRDVFHGDATAYNAAVTYRNLANGVTIKTQADAESSNAYVAYKLTIADGQAFIPTQITTDLYLADKSGWNYEFIIERNGITLFKSATQTIAAGKSGSGHKATLKLENDALKNLKGDIVVKFVYWINSSSTMLAIKDFTITGTVEEAQGGDDEPQLALVTYYDTDGTTVLGRDTVECGSTLTYKYGASDATVAEGKAFRGWFASTDLSALKVAEGTVIFESTPLYARATDIEVATVGSVFRYDLTQRAFYPEDHELITLTGGSYHDGQHGWSFGKNATIAVQTAGNALVNLSLCQYGNASTLTCVDAAGNVIGDPVTLPVASDGSNAVFRYTGPATTLQFTLSNGGYVHAIKIYNIEQVPTKNEAGYYVVSASDGASLLLLLETAQDGDQIFLPNGTYDFGSTTLTHIGKSISLIGQSMEGVLIVNHPLTAGMNNAETLFIETGAENVYFQDLAIRCDVSYETSIAGGVGIALQVRGDKHIMKQVDLQGNQDTYLSAGRPNQRAWYEDCRIEGTVDYVCGGGNIWFENTLFYNNARKNADVIFAPNTDPATVYGYVLHNCTVDGDDAQAGRWNLARGWQKSPAVTFLNTTCLIAPSTQGYTHMGADLVCRFHEYNTHLENGTVITGHNLDGLNYSVESDAIYLTGDSIYTYANVIKAEDNWDPHTIAAQVKADPENIVAEAAYLVEKEGEFVAVLKGSELSEQLDKLAGNTIRQANARGGFGAPVKIKDSETEMEEVTGDGSQVTGQKILRDGILLIEHNGRTYNVLGHEVK